MLSRETLRLWRYAGAGARLGSVAAATILWTCAPFAPGDGAAAAYVLTHLVALPTGLLVEAALERVADPTYAGIAFFVTAPVLNGAAAAFVWGLFVTRRRSQHPR